MTLANLDGPGRAEPALSRARGARRGAASLPATCGELVQGTLEGVPCLVSCPIGLYSTAQVTIGPELLQETPADAPKAVAALRAGQGFLGHSDAGVGLVLDSPIPRGRGYGSSTADVGASLYALAEASGQTLAPVDAARLAVGVEPSDSTLFPGLTLFDHIRGSFHEHLGQAPGVAVLVIDPGGTVDTIAFNQTDHEAALRTLAGRHHEAFALLRLGLARGDMAAVGQAASLSAQAHQTILFNVLLDRALSIAAEIGSFGVCRAHSGTILGILLPQDQAVAPDTLTYVARRLPADIALHQYTLVGGGPRTPGCTGSLAES